MPGWPQSQGKHPELFDDGDPGVPAEPPDHIIDRESAEQPEPMDEQERPGAQGPEPADRETPEGEEQPEPFETEALESAQPPDSIDFTDRPVGIEQPQPFEETDRPTADPVDPFEPEQPEPAEEPEPFEDDKAAGYTRPLEPDPIDTVERESSGPGLPPVIQDSPVPSIGSSRIRFRDGPTTHSPLWWS